MSDAFDENIVEEFAAECQDHLEAIEPDLLALEEEGANASSDIINRVFRAMHSIKGASSFLGFNNLTQLSHVMENVFMKIRDGELLPDPEKTDSLLKGIDKLQLMVQDIFNSNEINCDQEKEQLDAILAGQEPPPSHKPKPLEPSPPVPKKTSIPNPKQDQNHDPEMLAEYAEDVGKALMDILDDVLTLKLAQENTDQAVIKRLSKTMLSIKKASQFFGIERMIELSHTIQTLLEKTLAGDLELNSGMITAIIDGIGKGNHFVENIATCGSIECDAVLDQLNSFLRNKKDSEQEVVLTQKNEPENAGTPPLSELRASKTENIRVNVDVIDSLINLAGELVLGRNQLRSELDIIANKNQKLAGIMQNVDIVTSEIQENIMTMRMQPIGNLFNKFTRIVRDLSRQLGKLVNLTIIGKEVELDKTILEGLSDPLTHLIRNCLDHGFEPPDMREKAGKPKKGQLDIHTFHEGGQVVILVKDDGKGIDAKMVVEKAVSKGTISAETAAHLSDSEKIGLILLPGFSTAEKVTDISGRGVGMDVVKTNIEKLGGHLEIDSQFGQGTTVKIRLPLTLAIIPSLIVGASGQQFAIPQVNLQELLLIHPGEQSRQIEKIGDSEVLRLRGQLLPIIRLTKVLNMAGSFTAPETGLLQEDRRERLADRRQRALTEADGTEENDADISAQKVKTDRRKRWQSDINVVVLRIGVNIYGLVVDELFDNEEIVVKPLSDHIKDCTCFAGATIMGDGRVAMILDANGLAGFAELKFSEINAEATKRRQEEERRSKAMLEQRESVLLFNYALNEFFAIQLNSISRLELIQAEHIYRVGQLDFIDYQSQSLPLVRLDKYLPIGSFPPDLNELFLIIPKTKSSKVGIVVSRILDTVDVAFNLKKDNTEIKGLSATGFVDGQLMTFLNADVLLERIENDKFHVM